jgi:protein-tyrosine-phosphatase
VLFEPQNFVELRRAFPQYLDKIVMLGALLEPPRASIDDPYQRSIAETEHIAAQMEGALAELATLLGLTSASAIAEPARPSLREVC